MPAFQEPVSKTQCFTPSENCAARAPAVEGGGNSSDTGGLASQLCCVLSVDLGMSLNLSGSLMP